MLNQEQLDKLAAAGTTYPWTPQQTLAVLEENERLKAVLRDLLDACFDMSPLEFAESRGMDYMSDEYVSVNIVSKARELLGD